MLPELFYTQSLTLIFFLLVVIVLVVAFIHHYLQEKVASHRPPHQLVHDHLSQTAFPHPTDSEEVEDLEKYYKEHLEEVANNLQKRFDADIDQATKSFFQYLADLRVKADQTQSILDQQKTEAINSVFARMESTMSNVIDRAVTQSIASIQIDLENSKKSVEGYTKKQLDLVDQNIIDLLERTLSLVLVKKLSLREQLDLVYEALEKAKAEGFLTLPTQGEVAAKQPTANSPQTTDYSLQPEKAVVSSQSAVDQPATTPPLDKEEATKS